MNTASLSIILLLLLSACGSAEPTRSEEVFTPLDEEVQRISSRTNDWPLQSLVRLQASSSLLNFRDPIHIQLKAQMINNTSILRFHLYTSDLKQNNGTSLEFSREGQKLSVRVFTRDFPEVLLCEIEDSVGGNGNIDLRFQLMDSNAKGPVILIWNRFFNGRRGIQKDYTYFSASNADCNSEGNIILNNFGFGTLWGIDIFQTRLNQVIRSEAL